MEKSLLSKIAIVLVIIGALNWGFVIFDINLVELLALPWLIKTVYALVALSGLKVLMDLFR